MCQAMKSTSYQHLKKSHQKKVLLCWKGNICCVGSIEHPTYQTKRIPLCVLEDNTNIYETYCMQRLCSMPRIYYQVERYFKFLAIAVKSMDRFQFVSFTQNSLLIHHSISTYQSEATEGSNDRKTHIQATQHLLP